MSLSLSDLRNHYWRRINEGSSSADSHSETTTEVDMRLNAAYDYIQRITGCTFKKPELVSLTAKTPSTNYYDLSEILSLNTGASVMGIHEVFWDGIRLYEWNKARIDQMNEYDEMTGGITPTAYAFYTEGSGDDRKSYISFYRYISADNSTDCYISYFELLPHLSDTDDCPRFDAQWHQLIADVAADENLLDTGDSRMSSVRLARTEDNLSSMKAYYYKTLGVGDASPAPINRAKYKFYGE